MYARCLDCGKEYPSTATMDYGLCPGCQGIEEAMFREARLPLDEPPAWKYSRAAMRERLGTLTNRDE